MVLTVEETRERGACTRDTQGMFLQHLELLMNVLK